MAHIFDLWNGDTLENKELAPCEAKLYEHAPETILHLIPMYFGTYVRPDELWFAIVLEDVGACLKKELGIDRLVWGKKKAGT